MLICFSGVYCKCKESYPVKAKLKYDYYDYFSFISTDPNVDDMLKGSCKLYIGPFREDVSVTIKGMLYSTKIKNQFISKFHHGLRPNHYKAFLER